MVLERLVSLREALRNPWWVFLIGGIVSLTSLFVSFLIFPAEKLGLATSFMITLTMAPFMTSLLSYDESREEEALAKKMKQSLLQRHRQVLIIYTAFFSGMILSFSFVYLLLPQTVVESLFKEQLNEISRIRGSLAFFGNFEKILLNNIGVLFISFLFSFLFGAGAVFILTWNASMLSVVISKAALSGGGFQALPLAILAYFPHGSLEILAYFIGALAGGVVSIALTKRNSKWLFLVFKDSLVLVAIAVVLLVAAAFVETTSMIIISQ